ncbi:hypothetical protein RvY_06601 [Ramazzottius varieornatus]|uniref:G-protein coupled receptors family 1 profile domain-containing protein n=1 Tax=Ramazzottius varieornatus TaxID=947166 RepID=A0A1D1V4M5_RAMVA|nr:hypothetical protein RvY_06601 [Ramazzottius varieornatus]
MNNSTCAELTTQPLCLPPIVYATITSIIGILSIVAETVNVGIFLTLLLRPALISPFIIHIVNTITINTILLPGFISLALPRPLFQWLVNKSPAVCSATMYFTWGIACLNPLPACFWLGCSCGSDEKRHAGGMRPRMAKSSENSDDTLLGSFALRRRITR